MVKISNLEKKVISVLALGCLGAMLAGVAVGSKKVAQYGGFGFVTLAVYSGTKVENINYQNKSKRLQPYSS